MKIQYEAELIAAGCKRKFLGIMDGIIFCCIRQGNDSVEAIIARWKSKNKPEWFYQ